MVSAYFISSDILRVPDQISDEELLNNSSWPKNREGKPVQEAIKYLEYGKDSYWTREKMLKHTKEIVPPIYYYAFCDFGALFDLLNHSSFAHDALLASRMNVIPGGKQLKVRDRWNFQTP